MIRGGAAALLVVGASALPRVAQAHAPIEGIGSFWAGVIHPLVVPAHLVTLLSLGLVLGQQERRAAREGLVALVATLLAGMVVTDLIPARDAAPTTLLVLALILGVLCASALRLPGLLPPALAGAAGLLVGMDSAAGAVTSGTGLVLLGGIALGATLVVFYIAALAVGLERAWQRVGVRIVGSWTAASALLVLVLEVAGTRPVAAG